MPFRSPEDTIGRLGVGLGATILTITRIVHPEHENAWFWLGVFFVVLGLGMIPRMPEHYYLDSNLDSSRKRS